MDNAKKRKRNSLCSSNNGDLTQRRCYKSGLSFETTNQNQNQNQNQNLGTIFSEDNVGASTRRKIYVVGVGSDMAAWKLLEHFELYGEVEAGPLGYDLGTGRSTGYAVFVYKTAAGAEAALLDPVKIIDGRQLYCKPH